MIMLEGAKATTETVDALRTGASAMKAMQKATYVVLQSSGSTLHWSISFFFNLLSVYTILDCFLNPGTAWFCGLICNLHFYLWSWLHRFYLKCQWKFAFPYMLQQNFLKQLLLVLFLGISMEFTWLGHATHWRNLDLPNIF